MVNIRPSLWKKIKNVLGLLHEGGKIMGRLIDADELRFEIINKPSEFKVTEATIDFLTGLSKRTHEVLDILDEAPTVDAVPVVHGRWEKVKNPQWPAYSHDKCNICGWWNTKNALCYDGNHKPEHSLNYCPGCGAKMDGDNNE